MLQQYFRYPVTIIEACRIRMLRRQTIIDRIDSSTGQIRHVDAGIRIGFDVTDDPPTAMEKEQGFFIQMLFRIEDTHGNIMGTVLRIDFVIHDDITLFWFGSQNLLHFADAGIIFLHVDFW
ncbi:hypothetical protein SDC9_100958 [bioreactor metagenome]|uniref:Uncharacterized protein n=1 Tax=bioreactor metagenome TaxID=1076179 RepID=A0A645AXC2_9ZZZZ